MKKDNLQSLVSMTQKTTNETTERDAAFEEWFGTASDPSPQFAAMVYWVTEAWNAAWNRRVDLPPTSGEDGATVPIPQNADQAQLMANLGLGYLQQHAPERLKPVPTAPVAADPDDYFTVRRTAQQVVAAFNDPQTHIANVQRHVDDLEQALAKPIADTGAVRCFYMETGAEYEHLAVAKGAGPLRGSLFHVYRDESGQHYVRTPMDFDTRMTMAHASPAPTADSAADARDAARYRWLRDNWFTMTSNYKTVITFSTGQQRWSEITEKQLDATIDAAISTNTVEGK